MSHATKLFEPYQLGPITLSNRTVMAPLTRNRAVAEASSPIPWRSNITASAPAPGC